MKNLSLILNGVLILAVIVLYYLHFSSKSGDVASAGISGPSDLKVAYINSDSVLKYYDYFKANRDKLEAKGKKLGQELRNRAQLLQTDIEAYQRNVSSLTIGQAKAVEEDLGKKQANLQQFQQTLEQELQGEEAKLNVDLYGKVTSFLKKYGQQNGLQIVLKYDPSSDLLYGGDGLDITKDVIKGLNDSYKEELANPVKKDSTTKK